MNHSTDDESISWELHESHLSESHDFLYLECDTVG